MAADDTVHREGDVKRREALEEEEEEDVEGHRIDKALDSGQGQSPDDAPLNRYPRNRS